MTAASEPNPTVDRRELAVFFHDLREQRERGLDELAAILGIAASQASRLDTGARGFRSEDVSKLCRWYDIGAAEEERLVSLAISSSKRAWWQQAKIAASYRTLIGMERAALSINEYCGSVIPGLLQTRAYAEAVATNGQVGMRLDEAKRAASVRVRRQEILDRADPPELNVVLDEAALARGAGGTAVMGQQLQQLLDMASRPRVTIQVIDFDSGMYPVQEGQFILLRMAKKLPDLYYAETNLRVFDTSGEEDLRRAWQLWLRLHAIALSPQLSAQRIETYRDRLAQ